MSRLSDAQYALVDAIIEELSESKGLREEEQEALRSSVYADGGLWEADKWTPLMEFVGEHL